ncbi:hypothetical protein PCANC_23960 [Puccinia coronata f. sp. avenae]|uniref:cellulase n=1 Tax=Puccinia coronata f. sp. avenae TaxID=200324 RepID=A0A2N5S7D7_9BASI|nr:hypothetical protein PCANC_23960 [Puccinia coronata f. sp. avenae]
MVTPVSRINLAGFDFGAQNDGTYTASNGNPAYPPPESQIDHFLSQNVNFFRIPVAWEYLQSEVNGALNEKNLATYKKYIDQITEKKAYVAIDLHAYARFKGQIVGESPTMPATALANFWSQMGAVFKNNTYVMLGLVNEPHDLDIHKWAKTVNTTVEKLRKKDINNVLLIPGTEYTAMKAFPEWYPAMKDVKNPDGSLDGLVFEVHRYLDSDNSGKDTKCVASHADEVQKLVEILKDDGRQVLLGEIGGGNTESCVKFLPELAEAVKNAYPTFAGLAMWAAGSFDASYELVTTVKNATSPTGWTDQPNWLSIKPFIPAKGSDKGTENTKTRALLQPLKSLEQSPSCTVEWWNSFGGFLRGSAYPLQVQT